MKTILKYVIIFLILVYYIPNGYTQITDTLSFDKFSQSFEDFAKTERQKYDEFVKQANQEYETYVKAEQEAFNKFKQEVEGYWGKDNFATSSKKEWVEYSEDKKSRSIVNFETGKIKVETLLPEQQNITERQVIERVIQSSIKNLSENTGSSKDYSTRIEPRKNLEISPIVSIEDMGDDKGESFNTEQISTIAKDIVKDKAYTVKEVKGKDGKLRKEVSVELSLAPDYIKKRAAKFKTSIQKYAKKYNIPPALLYAIIHTESYYNPKATSHVPAYGLMQLVPKSGARDAYQYVYGKDKILTANYLYNADKNIELGTAYLRLLMDRYFSDVTNPKTRELCAIASYNTGAGNLARAFVSSKNPCQAVPLINKMTYKEVFNHLKKHLPYKETQDYIVKVSNRMASYEEWTK